MKSKNRIQAGAVVAAALMATLSAQAVGADTKQAAPTPGSQGADSNVSLYRQLDALRSQNATLTEALKNAELKNKLNNVDKNPTMVPSLTPGSISGNAYLESSASLPLVQMVSGSGKNLTALISLSNGGRVTARVGSNIPGLGVVKSISLNEVAVENKKQTIILPFASDSAGSPGGSAIPSLPMMPGGAR